MRIINLYQKNKKASEHTRERMLKDYIYIYIYMYVYMYIKKRIPLFQLDFYVVQKYTH